MSREQLFDQPEFVPQFDDLTVLGSSRIALTGRTGVLGRIVAERCASAGLAMSAFEGDVTDSQAVDAWLRDAKPALVLHFAALVPVTEVERNPLRAYEVNALGSFHVASSTIRHAPRAWLFLASSSHVYAPTRCGSTTPISEDSALEPASFYGVSKLAGERLAVPVLTRCQVPFCVGRIFSFSHDTQLPPYLVPSLRARISDLPEGGTLRVATPAAVRDILDAETVVDIVLALAKRHHVGTVNIGSGRGLSVKAIAQRLAARVGKSITIEEEGAAVANALVADVTRLRSALGGGILAR